MLGPGLILWDLNYALMKVIGSSIKNTLDNQRIVLNNTKLVSLRKFFFRNQLLFTCPGGGVASRDLRDNTNDNKLMLNPNVVLKKLLV